MKRRALAGCTHDPYECCGKDGGSYGRPKGSICPECKQLIAEATVARRHAERAKTTGEVQPYWWHEVDYAAPNFYGYGVPREHEEQLKAAIWQLVAAASQPAPADTPKLKDDGGEFDWKTHTHERDVIRWEHVTKYAGSGHSLGDWLELVLMAPAVRGAVANLDAVLRVALPATFLRGKDAGRKVLLGMASGEVSLDDFEDALLSQDERSKKRRG